MSMTFYVNNDTQDEVRDASGVDWTQVAIAGDKIIFTAGSDAVKDGEALPSETELNRAGVLVSETVAVDVDLYLLYDLSAGLLKEIHNAGNQNKRYVFCFAFDAATASEPVLELWDDEDLDTVAILSLGSGTPSSSWWRGICTTDALPGADWVNGANDIPLAGSTDGHFIELNAGNGALSVAKDLYCNLAIQIPANPGASGSAAPIFVVKWTSN